MLKTLILVSLFSISAQISFAQLKQKSFDSKHRIYYIDKEFNTKAKVLPPVQGLQKHSLYKHTDTSDILSTYYTLDTVRYRKDSIISDSASAQIRSSVDNYLDWLSKNTLNQEGRTLLLTSSALHGVAAYGWMLPFSFHMHSERLVIGTYMLTSGASFFIPYFGTKNKTVRYADTWACINGQTHGLAHGALLGSTFQQSSSFSIAPACGIAFSIGEAFGAYKYTQWKQLSSGQVWATTFISDWTGAIGLFGYNAFSKEMGYNNSVYSYLIGTSTGLVAGNILSTKEDYSTGDAMVALWLPALGSFSAITSCAILEARNENLIFGTLAFGTATGIALSHISAKNNQFSTGDGFLLSLASLATGTSAMGLTYIAIGDIDDAYKAVMASGVIGSISGYCIMKHFLKRHNTKAFSSASFDLRISPMALANESSFSLNDKWQPPLVTLRYKL